MKRWSIALLLIALPSAVAAQQPASAPGAAARIANAMSAAPSFISAQATILEWAANETAKPAVLRQGTNGWTCLPDLPFTEGNDPMCLDATWLKFMDAHMSQKTPQVDAVGVGYMLAEGGAYFSSSDPFATARTATNNWGFDGPHMMIVVPDARTLQGLPTTRESGGPYVMFAGTPYAHIMIPTAQASKPAKQN